MQEFLTKYDDIKEPIKYYLDTVGQCADELGYKCCVVGGFVRDYIINRQSHDLDFVCEGSGIQLAKKVQEKLGVNCKLDIFESYGTAHIIHNGIELEFVGARREFYHRESRNPIVEDGTLYDDLSRRDLTINNLAISLNNYNKGELLDCFNGLKDLEEGIIRTPLDPDITFSDDPLRMLRAIRFTCRFHFNIEDKTLSSIKNNIQRIKIITQERITEELNKILLTDCPSEGFRLLEETGLLDIIFPELHQLNNIEYRNGVKHKNVFLHTLEVLDNVSKESDKLYLRWASLLHDIGKLKTKKFDDEKNVWTFYNHQEIGEKMIPKLFTRFKLPLDERMLYVKKLVGLHMRPINLVHEGVTDSGIRRLLFSAGDDIDDLMLLAASDITSKKEYKKSKYKENYLLLKKRMVEIEENDHIRNFQPPIDGNEIMKLFHLEPCKMVGEIKESIKNAILDGKIQNTYEDALDYINKHYK